VSPITKRITSGPWWAALLRGVALLAIGIVFIYTPRVSANVSIRLLGATLLFFGALTILELAMGEYKNSRGIHLLFAIVAIIVGLFMLTHTIIAGALTLTTISVILGSSLLVVGVLNIVFGFMGDGWAVVLLGVVSLILGIILVTRPLKVGIVLPVSFGLIAAVGGAILIVLSIWELITGKHV
jgi:uncharacterized membrane protein HdeD (DUF308 family)